MNYGDSLLNGPAWDGTAGNVPADSRWYVRFALLPSAIADLVADSGTARADFCARVSGLCSGSGVTGSAPASAYMVGGPSVGIDNPDPMEDARYCFVLVVSSSDLTTIAGGSNSPAGTWGGFLRLLAMMAGYPDPFA